MEPRRAGLGDDEEWRRKGATISDKTARLDFGLTNDDIMEAIDSGKLQYRVNSTHGNPWFRLLRREVGALVESRYDVQYLKKAQARAELARVNRELKRLRAEVAVLEQRRNDLIADLEE